jgi:hypothetical protein
VGTYILMGHIEVITIKHTDIHRAKQNNAKNMDATGKEKCKKT